MECTMEVSKLLEEFPVLNAILNRERRIEEYEAKAESEQDMNEKAFLYECCNDMRKTNFREVLKFYTEYIQKYTDASQKLSSEVAEVRKQLNSRLQEYAGMCQELADKLQEERRQYNEDFITLYAGLREDPCGVLKIMTQVVERRIKVEDQSGDAWNWGLQFGFIDRIKMAWKLLIA